MWNVINSVILICHLLVALVLLGAVTHQAISLLWPAKGGQASLVRSYRAVRSNLYTNVVIVLFIVTVVFGSLLYPQYRISVLTFLTVIHIRYFGGLFELKEHFAAIGLGLLPLYWLLWKKLPLTEHVRPRAVVTTLLAFFVWYNLLVGHIINNLKGVGL
jgi:hypothetical protein